MNSLEEFLKINRAELDSELPDPGHEFRFEGKLKARLHKKDAFIVRYAVAIAASILIFIGTSIYIYKLQVQGLPGSMKASQSVEFIEAEQYYTAQTDKAILKLKEALSAQPRSISSPLFSELKQMEDSYKQLNDDLKKNPNDIRLMSAIVQYHQLKLDLVNNLIERFTLYSNTKIKHHENGKI